MNKDQEQKQDQGDEFLKGMGYIGLCVIILCVLAFFWYKGITTGSEASHYKKICIEGQTFIRCNFMTKMGLAPLLDDDGRPIKCKEGDY